MASIPSIPAISATPPVDAGAPVQTSAFDATLQEALGSAGHIVDAALDRLEGLQARAAHLAAARTTETAPLQASDASTAHNQDQRHMLGVMLETYEMAIEAEIVSRAATTLTSSVNTLIKTQ